MRKIPYNEKRRNKCEYCAVYRDGSCKWQKCHYEHPKIYKGIRNQYIARQMVEENCLKCDKFMKGKPKRDKFN